MAYFAKINENNIVENVTAIPDEYEHCGQEYLNELGIEGRWVQTSYSTYGNVHYDMNTGLPSDTQYKALRKNYAGIGYRYDETLDAFIPPKPEDRPSYILNPETALWQPPIPPPASKEGGQWFWAELEQEWFWVPDPENPEMI